MALMWGGCVGGHVVSGHARHGSKRSGLGPVATESCSVIIPPRLLPNPTQTHTSEHWPCMPTRPRQHVHGWPEAFGWAQAEETTRGHACAHRGSLILASSSSRRRPRHMHLRWSASERYFARDILSTCVHYHGTAVLCARRPSGRPFFRGWEL